MPHVLNEGRSYAARCVYESLLERFTVIDSDGEARNNPIDDARGVAAAQAAAGVDKHEVGRVAQGGGASPMPIGFSIFIVLTSFRFCLQTIE